MNVLCRWFTCLSLLAVMGMSPAMAADSDTQADEQMVANLLETMVEGNYQRFVGYGTPAFGALTEEQFKDVAAQVGPGLEQGYGIEYFGMLRQQGLDVSVWKITFSNNDDDLLATLNMQEGKVGGFYLR